MTMDDDDKHKFNQLKLRSGSHEVGYGRPPAKDRFVKGQSGNPAGRPPASRNKPKALDPFDLQQMILTEANRAIEILEQGEVVTMPTVQAVMRKMGIDALKGNARAQQQFLKWIDKTHSSGIQLHERQLQAVCE